MQPKALQEHTHGEAEHGCWHMLSTGELYREAGGDYFTRRDPDRATPRLVAQLERLGHTVTLQEAAA